MEATRRWRNIAKHTSPELRNARARIQDYSKCKLKNTNIRIKTKIQFKNPSYENIYLWTKAWRKVSWVLNFVCCGSKCIKPCGIVLFPIVCFTGWYSLDNSYIELICSSDCGQFWHCMPEARKLQPSWAALLLHLLPALPTLVQLLSDAHVCHVTRKPSLLLGASF